MHSTQKSEFTIDNKILKGIVRPCSENHKRNFSQVLFESISKYGNQVARIKVETGEQRSFNDIQDYSVCCALWLKKQGIKAGDVVVLCTNNQLDSCIPAIATIYVGAVLTSWIPSYDIERHQFYLNFLQPKAIFVCEASLHMIQEAVKLTKVSSKIIVFGKSSGFQSLLDIINQQLPEEVQKYQPEEKSDSLNPALIIFSSGSTGTPKAITLAYNSLLENIYSFCPVGSVVALYYTPMEAISGIALTIYFLLNGSVVIVDENNFEPKRTFKILEQYEVNFTLISPFGMTKCYKEKILTDFKLPSLNTILTGSSPLNLHVYQAFKVQYRHVNVIIAYGLSELGSLATYNLGSDKGIDSIGFIKPNIQLKVVDVTTQRALGPNKQGELCLKSSGMMVGYYMNPHETRTTIDEEGWLHTGDLGYYDEEGEIFLVGRLKEVMKWRNNYVLPIEMERILLKHPGVANVAVVPVPDDADGDRPMAFVEKSSGSQVTEEKLIEFSSKIGNGIRLWGGVKFLDELPLTASAKIDKYKLKILAKQFKKEL